MQREEMVGWWGSSGEAQQVPLLVSSSHPQNMLTTKPARIRRFSLCQQHMWGTGENWSINIRVDWVPDSVVVRGRIELGLQTVSGRVWRADKLQLKQRTWKPFLTWSSGRHRIYVPAPAIGGLTSPLLLSLESSEPPRSWPGCDELGVSVMNRQTNRTMAYPARNDRRHP